MIKQNVIIVGFNSLYEILDEIKDNLSFNIINYKDENHFNNKKKDILNTSLIIINKKNRDLSKKNVLAFNDLPIRLNKLVELINVNLIKLKFSYQSKINIKGYELNLNSKFFSKNENKLKLTEKEIEIILYLSAKKIKYSVLDLQKNIWGYSSSLETHTVETHIYRLRKKIKDQYNDSQFIISHDKGYFIE
jgi:hypothetical protein